MSAIDASTRPRGDEPPEVEFGDAPVVTDPWAAERFFLAGFAAFCVVALLAVRAYALIERRPASWGGFLSILTVSLAMAATIAHAPPPPRWRRLVATGFSAGLVLAALFAMALL